MSTMWVDKIDYVESVSNHAAAVVFAGLALAVVEVAVAAVAGVSPIMKKEKKHGISVEYLYP
jgi:hypothetical protein